jgi:hypothetical protein
VFVGFTAKRLENLAQALAWVVVRPAAMLKGREIHPGNREHEIETKSDI